jgi:hypothetical protein
MSQNQTSDQQAHLESTESPKDNLPKLAELARQAYEQKRTKDCLDLTRAILLIDPDNSTAHWMRSSIQSELHRDLENARAFLRQAQSKESAVDPVELPSPEVAEPVSIPSVEVAPVVVASSWNIRKRWFVPATVLIAFGVVAVGAPLFKAKWTGPVDASPRPVSVREVPPANVNLSAVEPDPLSVHSLDLLAGAPPVSTPSPAPVADRISASVADPLRPAKALDVPPIAASPGTLAISSPTSVDIYKDDAYIGSAPVSLELPAGPQTLEYRHGNLRRQVTHVIKSNETTKAMITFDVTVQINSRPWADVFLDGVERKALGQTPLSGVRVPIGGVLVFENPQFQAKRYRVNGNETGIQIVFP